MKKLFLCLAMMCVASAASAATLSATIAEVAGKVEYKVPGKDWKPAKVGDIVPKGTVISTGFKSTALLTVGASTITVKPVTRLSLEELVESASGTQTQLFLLAGRVKADVTPQSGKVTEFKVKSPTATASVRGTGFEFDGVNLVVERGLVELRTPTGLQRSVAAGEFSYVSSSGDVTPPAAVSLETGLDRVDELVDQADSESRAAVQTMADASTRVDTGPATDPEPDPVPVTGSITITLQ